MGTAFKKLKVSAIKRCIGAGLRMPVVGRRRFSEFHSYSGRIIMLRFCMLAPALISACLPQSVDLPRLPIICKKITLRKFVKQTYGYDLLPVGSLCPGICGEPVRRGGGEPHSVFRGSGGGGGGG